MEFHPNVTFIPAKPKKRDKNVAIYARVSSNSMEQLSSLTAQVSNLTKFTVANPTWLLVDVYMDIASSKTNSYRKEFNRLVDDATQDKVDVVIVKSISRFGRDTVEVLTAVEKLVDAGVRVVFITEGIDTEKDDYRLFISIHESCAQAENETRSANIKWGIKQQALQGTSKLFNRPCYGYVKGDDGLEINEKQAKVVRKIFDWYLNGMSIVGIIKELEKQEIKSPKGKDSWYKKSIETMISNEKYIGNTILLDNGKYENAYKMDGNHEAIISDEIFQAVQIEKGRRSNVVVGEDGVQRKSKKYSSKR